MIRNTAAACAAVALLAGGASSAWAQQSNAGDIPDSQVFVDYASPLGFSLQVPEGWARTTTPDGARFVDHYDSVAVSVVPAAALPTPEAAPKPESQSASLGPSAVISKAVPVTEPAGRAVRLVYTSASAANPVTGKAIKLENERFLFWKDGKLATLTLSAPLGADNVDQWRLMSRSFRWN